jgi:parallel beta-helix repeat protein
MNSKFNDNFISICYLPNRTRTKGIIANCGFTCNGPLRQPVYCGNPPSNASMRSIIFIKIKDVKLEFDNDNLIFKCGFRNLNEADERNNNTIAIDVEGGTATVKSCYFKNVEKGVQSSGGVSWGSGTKKMDVTCSKFEKVRMGVSVLGNNYVGTVLNNNFISPILHQNSVEVLGIFADGANSMLIDNNTLENYRKGITAFSSPSIIKNNTIYYKQFYIA